QRRGDSVGQITGGWDEIVDSFVDLGIAPARGLTRRESATYIESRMPDSGVIVLADGADRAVFGPEEPDPSTAAHYSREVRRAAARMGSTLPWRSLWQARMSLWSLRRKRRLGKKKKWSGQWHGESSQSTLPGVAPRLMRVVRAEGAAVEYEAIASGL